MKKVKFAHLRLLLMAAVMTFLASCQDKSPVAEYASIFNSLADKVEKTTSEAEYAAVMNDSKLEDGERLKELMENNADYELTPEDKTQIKEAITRLYTASMKKSLEFQGQSTEGCEAIAESVLEAAAYPVVDRARTLNDVDIMGK